MHSMTVVLALVLIVPGIVRAADKAQSTLAQPGAFTGSTPPALSAPSSSAWTNGVGKGKAKFVGCVTQILLKNTTLPDSDGTPGTGDEVICIIDFTVSVPSTANFGSFVTRGESSGGAVKIKFDLGLGSPCPGPLLFYDERVACYEKDPAYAPPLDTLPSDHTQGIHGPGYAPRPASPLIATGGRFFP